MMNCWLLLVAVVAFIQHAQASFGAVEKCHDGWTLLPDTERCFKMFHDRKTWEGAKNSCDNLGWSLLNVLDQKQNDFVLSKSKYGHLYWIGAQTNMKKELVQNIDYAQVDGGFSNWKKGEPNGAGKECVEFQAAPWKGWNDNWCGTKNSYICQQDIYAKVPKTEECPEGFSLLDGKCLMFNKRKYGYKRAESFCDNLGGNLADITSKEMGETLKTQTKKRGYWWTGAHTSQRLNAIIFQSGKRVNETYANWGSDQPKEGKHCVEVVARNAEWRSQRCNKRNRFVCQVPSLKELQSQGRCPEGWLQLDASCIKNTKQYLSWANGKALCEKQNARLLETYDASFSTTIMRFMKSTDRIWLGAKNDKKKPLTFKWNSGSKLVHTNWFFNSPSIGWPVSKCVDFAAQGYWGDVSCDTERLIFCEQQPAFENIRLTSDICPGNSTTWSFLNGVCYKKFEDKVKADVAFSKCEELGGRLANPKNIRIFNYLMKMVKEGEYLWIGANDKETEGEFKWTDGTPMEFSQWKLDTDYNKQPDNGTNHEEPDQDCVTTSFRGNWYDEDCDGWWTSKYWCEYDGK